MAQKQGLQNRQKLAAVFASFTILTVGTLSLLESMSLDYYSVLNTLGKVIPASIIIGGLGYVMGLILDQPKRRKRTSYSSFYVNDIMKKGSQATETPSEEKEASE